MPITIVLADEHEIVRAGIAELLARKPDIEVIGQCSKSGELLEMVERLTPDVTIIGIPMRDFNDYESTRRIRQISPSTRVILFGERESGLPYGERRFSKHSAAYLSKTGRVRDLMETIADVVKTGKRRSRARRSPDAISSEGAAFQRPPETTENPLSQRERQILQLVASGKSSKEIAAHLRIGETTVKTHREHIMDKLGTRSIAGLTRKAVRLNLVSAE